MNGPEILQLIRHDLQRAIARQGKPPTPRPLDVSPWLAMSVLQKAIRRGREDLALGAAATLLRDAPDKLWRRTGCIAYEDVGIANLETVGLATAALGGKRIRVELGGEWAVASSVVSELSRAPKCRAADDLLMACELHPAYAEARAGLAHLITRDLIKIATAQGSVQERALALWYAVGTDRRPSGLVSRRGEPRLVFDYLSKVGWPHSIVEVAREGFRRTGEMLCPLVALLSCEPRQPPGSRATNSHRRRCSVTFRAGRWTSTRGRAGLRSRAFSKPTRPPPVGYAAASGPRAGSACLDISSSGSKRACRQPNAVAAGARASPPSRRRVLGSQLRLRHRNPGTNPSRSAPHQRRQGRRHKCARQSRPNMRAMILTEGVSWPLTIVGDNPERSHPGGCVRAGPIHHLKP